MREAGNPSFLSPEQRGDHELRVKLIEMLENPDRDPFKVASTTKELFDLLNNSEDLFSEEVKEAYIIEYASIIRHFFNYLDGPRCSLGNDLKSFYKKSYAPIIEAKDQIEKKKSSELATFDRK